MIRAFEHQLLNRLITRRAQSIGEPVRIQRETGKVLEGIDDQKRWRIGPDVRTGEACLRIFGSLPKFFPVACLWLFETFHEGARS